MAGTITGTTAGSDCTCNPNHVRLTHACAVVPTTPGENNPNTTGNITLTWCNGIKALRSPIIHVRQRDGVARPGFGSTDLQSSYHRVTVCTMRAQTCVAGAGLFKPFAASTVHGACAGIGTLFSLCAGVPRYEAKGCFGKGETVEAAGLGRGTGVGCAEARVGVAWALPG